MKLFIKLSLIIITDIICTSSLCQTPGQSVAISANQKLAREIFAELIPVLFTGHLDVVEALRKDIRFYNDNYYFNKK